MAAVTDVPAIQTSTKRTITAHLTKVVVENANTIVNVPPANSVKQQAYASTPSSQLAHSVRAHTHHHPCHAILPTRPESVAVEARVHAMKILTDTGIALNPMVAEHSVTPTPIALQTNSVTR